jgi:hypothetical protein
MSVEKTIEPTVIADWSADKINIEPKVNTQELRKWTFGEKFTLRTSAIFFVIMSIPWSPEWYKGLFGINWFSIHYRDLYDIARFQPALYKFKTPAYNLLGYADWLQVLAIALIGAGIWSAVESRKSKLSYDALYYWVRVIVRYRAGIGIIGFGFTKLFPTQMPYPSLGLLNTNLGDFTAQKIYWLSVGIVPWYQVFAGLVELAAGTLLFFRKTTTLGAALLLGALGDITYVNFAYDGGVHIYASYFVLFALFLLGYDVVPVYNLFVRERFTAPFTYQPLFKGWLRSTRLGLKVVTIFIFLVYFTYAEVLNFKYDPYKQPAMKGVTMLRGNYHVTEFKINSKLIPYSPLDTIRWHDVTFEKWSSLTYNVNKPTKLDLSNGGGSPMRDINRTFEITGTAGGKRVFYYDVDTVNQVLYLQDKYVPALRRGKDAKAKAEKPDEKQNAQWIPKASLANIADEYHRIDKVALSARRKKGIAQELKDKRKRNHMILKYATTDGSRVVLSGIDEHKDSVYIVLNRYEKNYVLKDSKLQAGKY